MRDLCCDTLLDVVVVEVDAFCALLLDGCDLSNYPNLLVAIGASAGGLAEIVRILEYLPKTFQGSLIIATHREPNATNYLSEILKTHSRVRVEEPIDNGHLMCATVYVGASDERVAVTSEGDFDIEIDTSLLARIRRIDDLFISVAEAAGSNAIGVILSGMLSDGAEGLAAIQKAGGHCFVQQPRDATFDSMPIEALNSVDVDYVGTAEEIAERLVEIASHRTCE